jgi:hypothetical protein
MHTPIVLDVWGEAIELIEAHDAEILREAADRAREWLRQQGGQELSEIPAIRELRERQIVALRAAVEEKA